MPLAGETFKDPVPNSGLWMKQPVAARLTTVESMRGHWSDSNKGLILEEVILWLLDRRSRAYRMLKTKLVGQNGRAFKSQMKAKMLQGDVSPERTKVAGE